ncbi:hypothetical protein ACD591_19830 [Rufibacter glacialis]|uniref:PorT family protein n=1 Tax=Rufibacter glacialis TaxID=1259555 RepID=A0ABV4RMG8_9BACT|nr:hypothetical protein [Rufibacter glacialis]GGK85006.1 hypothetical protein GCM10011405_36040 [Rufibacter glacialis]
MQGILYGFLRGIFSDVVWERNRRAEYGPIQLSYSYALSEKVDLGLSASLTQLALQGRYFEPDSPQNPNYPPMDYEKVIARETRRYLAVMPVFSFKWIQEEKVTLYSGASLGALQLVTRSWFEGTPPQELTEVIPAAHLHLIGVQYGKRVRVYGELGFGVQGVLNGGVAFKL